MNGQRAFYRQRWFKAVAAFVAVVLIAWFGINTIWPTIPMRVKLTVDVKTPQGIKSGSSVIEIVKEHHIEFLPEVAGVTSRVTGEAVFVDLGDGRNLVVTLTGRVGTRAAREPRSLSVDELPIHILKIRPWEPPLLRADIARAAQEPPSPIPLERLPLVVTFRDLNNPLSVEEADPANLAASFGKSYRLSQATIQITSDRLTEGIGKKLTWLTALNGGYLHGGKTSAGSPLGLFGGNFKSEGLGQ